MIVAARTLAPKRPMEKRSEESPPASGPRAAAASAALVIVVPAGVQGRGRGHDDEDGDHVGPHGADHGVGLLEAELLFVDALLGHGRLEVELHVRRDRRAHDRDHEQEQGRVEAAEVGRHERPADLAPVGPGQEGRGDVGHEDEHDRQEDLLDRPVVREQDERPDGDGDDGHRDQAGHAEDAQRGPGAGELGDRVGQVGDEQDGHGDDRPAHAEAIADEIGEPLAGDDAEAGGHLLDDGQDDHRDGEEPEELEARAWRP